jgi:uncharacterized protein with von Willebrand factor type A (vWA) domain
MFGTRLTRLTRLTRALRIGQPDMAMDRATDDAGLVGRNSHRPRD